MVRVVLLMIVGWLAGCACPTALEPEPLKLPDVIVCERYEPNPLHPGTLRCVLPEPKP